jgi:hypothetical protein
VSRRSAPYSPERFALAEAALHERAVAAVGHEDFGDSSYLEGLRVLLEAYDHEAKLSPVGRHLAYQGILDILTTRLRVQSRFAENPWVLETKIDRPLVICGLVRTGSTALHHLVGRDPGIQVLAYWLACHPQPCPPRETWEDHPDFQAAATELEGMYAVDPSLKAIHFMEADGPEECRHFLSQNFTDDGFEVNATVPSYVQWYEAKYLKDTYLRHRDLLKLVGSTRPDRRWVLKYPVHLKHLRALLEVYPDACIVWTHRDPTQVLSSYVSLVASFRALFEEEIDRNAIAREQLEVWARASPLLRPPLPRLYGRRHRVREAYVRVLRPRALRGGRAGPAALAGGQPPRQARQARALDGGGGAVSGRDPGPLRRLHGHLRHRGRVMGSLPEERRHP